MAVNITKDESIDGPAPQGPPAPSKAAPTAAPTQAQPAAQPTKVQDNPDFKNLPREYQKAVENGANLAAVVADAKKRGEFGEKAAAYQAAGAGAGGGGGGGGAGGGGGGSGTGFASNTELGGSDALGGDADKSIKEYYDKILSGEEGRFSPEIMAQMKQGIFRESMGRAKASRDTAIRDSARFGTMRGGVLQARLQEIDSSSRAQYTQGVTDLMIEKAKTEFDDKMAALQGTQQWLSDKRQFYLGQKQIEATIESARIQAGATVAAAALSAGATKAAAGAAAGAARHAANLGHEQWKAEFDFMTSNVTLQNAAAASGAATL
jgi:hypothetical protein